MRMQRQTRRQSNAHPYTSHHIPGMVCLSPLSLAAIDIHIGGLCEQKTCYGVKSIHFRIHIQYTYHKLTHYAHNSRWQTEHTVNEQTAHTQKQYKYVVHDTRPIQEAKGDSYMGKKPNTLQQRIAYPNGTMTSCICACYVFRSGNEIVHNETKRDVAWTHIQHRQRKKKSTSNATT